MNKALDVGSSGKGSFAGMKNANRMPKEWGSMVAKKRTESPSSVKDNIDADPVEGEVLWVSSLRSRLLFCRSFSFSCTVPYSDYIPYSGIVTYSSY